MSVGLYRSYVALLLGALVPIWTGSHASLVMPAADRKKLRKLRKAEKERSATADAQDSDEEEEEETTERLTREDALWFPIVGSCVLLGLFLLFRFLDKRLLNRILGGYLALLAVVGLTRTLTRIVRSSLGAKRYNKSSKWRLLLTRNKDEWLKISLTTYSLGAFAVALGVATAQMYTTHWVLVNVVALSFAYNAISLIALDSFITGSILLAGLFVYDVWWVFGSQHVFGDNVMVEVATSFDGPIKIVFPRNLAAGRDFTLLGLGDIVLPGIFLALALRFDYALARARSPAPLRPRANFAKPYFMACFFAYILGLCVTMAMMHYFRAAQPALLYLSPACILAVALTALARGELNAFWRYVEEEEEPSSQEKGREKEGEESQDQSSPKESLVDVEATGRSSSHDSPAECRVDDPGSARDLPEVTPRLRQRANASK
ncbi:hypothetical protein JCM8115_007009 [Rhodotorula mucilaginosa]